MTAPVTPFIPGISIAMQGNLYVRMLDSNGDYTFGYGPGNWWGPQSEAVAQCVYTRLQLNQGDWFLNTADGTPWNTKVLGKSSPQTRSMVLKARILGTSNLSSIVTFAASINNTRDYTWSATVLTAFSSTPIAVSNAL